MTTASPALTLQSALVSDLAPKAKKKNALVQLPDVPDAERTRLRHLQAARKAYAGDWTGKMPLKIGKNEPDDNTTVNRCGPIVDMDVSWMCNGELELQVLAANAETPAPKPAMDYLMAALGCTGDNIDPFLVLMTNIVQSGAISGHPFVKLIPGKNGILPRTIVLDSANIWVDTDPEDVNLAMAYNIQYDFWNAPKQRICQKRQVISRVDPDDDDSDAGQFGPDTTWLITTYQRPKPAESMTIDQQRAVGWMMTDEEEWDHPWPPIHDCKNLPSECRYYGSPSLTPDLIHLNEVINRVLSYITKICRIYGHPWVWAAGLQAHELETTPGSIICLPGEDQKLNVAEAHGDLANMQAYALSLMISMDELSRTPAVAQGRMTELPRSVTGISLEVLLRPRLEKTEHQRRLYGPLLTGLCEHILELGGFKGLHVSIKWPNSLPSDDLAMAQLDVTLSQDSDISKHTKLNFIGLNYDVERSLRQEEAQDTAQDQKAGVGQPPMPPGVPNLAQGTDPNNPQNAQQQGAAATAAAAGTGAAQIVNHPEAVRQRALMAATAKKLNG